MRCFCVDTAEEAEEEDDIANVDVMPSGVLPAKVSASGIWRVWCLESVYRLFVYFLLSLEVIVEFLLVCRIVGSTSGREICSILSISAVLDLNHARARSRQYVRIRTEYLQNFHERSGIR